MFTALLLPLLVAGPPAGAGVRAAGDDPAIQVWISSDRRFLPGEHAKVQVRTREDGYLIVLHADPDGHLRVLFPIDPKDDNFVRGGRKYEIRGRAGRESFTADDRTGRGTVYAAVSHDPMRFDEFMLTDHWDYRNLAPQRLAADPEPELNDLVRRMVDGSFDYDALTYDVIERVVYADSYGSSYYDDPYYGSYYGAYGCGYSYYGCGRSYYGSPFSVSIGLFFGRPYSYRRYYSYYPYYAAYDPFYEPFFYDPYYYRPTYIYPARYYPYYGGYYNHPYYGGYGYNRYWNRPYTPYRFRPADGFTAGYRDRRYDLRRSVNTVYMPPKVADRGAPIASPGRRVSEPAAPNVVGSSGERRGTGSADRGAVRRTPDRAAERTPGRRSEGRGLQRSDVGPNIEARRAREPDERRSIIPDNRDARGRDNLPTEVRPVSRSDDARRRATPREETGGSSARPVEIEARPARPARQDDGRRGNDARGSDVRGNEGSRGATRAEPRPEPRAEPRSEPRPEARPSDRGGDRGSYSPQPRSDGGSRGGWGGSGGGGNGGGDRGGGGSGGGGGGGRRR